MEGVATWVIHGVKNMNELLPFFLLNMSEL